MKYRTAQIAITIIVGAGSIATLFLPVRDGLPQQIMIIPAVLLSIVTLLMISMIDRKEESK